MILSQLVNLLQIKHPLAVTWLCSLKHNRCKQVTVCITDVILLMMSWSFNLQVEEKTRICSWIRDQKVVKLGNS